MSTSTHARVCNLLRRVLHVKQPFILRYGAKIKLYCDVVVILHFNQNKNKYCFAKNVVSFLGIIMQSLLQFKYLVIVYIIVQPLIVIAEDQENLGLITNIGIFKLATDIEKSYLSVTVLANSSLDTFSSYINRINNSAHSPANIAGLKADKDLRAKFYEGFFPGSTALWDIAVDLEIISSYKDLEKSSNPTYDCHAIYNIPNELHFLEISNTLEFALSTLNFEWTGEELNQPPAKQLLLDYIHDSKLDILNLATLVREQLQLLDELTLGRIPLTLISYLQQQLSCWPFGTYENAYLENCNKIAEGLECDIYLEVYKEYKEYNRYLPINYQGVELHLGNHTVLIKDSEESMALLSCPTLNENFINNCNKVNYDNKCADNLLEENYDKAVEYCNFTLKLPIDPFLTSKKGILIMDKNIDIQLFKGDKKFKSIENKSPLLLFTKHIVKLISNTITSTFQSNNNDVEKIIYSILNKTLITKMRNKALKKAISELDIYSILQYMALTVHIAIFPVALVSCCVSLKALKAFKPMKRTLKMLKRSGKHKDNSPVVKRSNYVHNKRYQNAMKSSF